MATYDELAQFAADEVFRSRLSIAIILAADAIRADSGATTQAKTWARRAYFAPVDEMNRMVWAILAVNKDSDIAVIQAASDAVLQVQVDSAVALFVSEEW